MDKIFLFLLWGFKPIQRLGKDSAMQTVPSASTSMEKSLEGVFLKLLLDFETYVLIRFLMP